MFRFKRGAALVLSLTVLFSLAACRGGQNSSSETAETVASVSTQPTEAPKADALDQIISGMSLEEKVGQMFYVRCPDVNAAEWVAKYYLGGYILFGRDFTDKTKEEVVQNIQSYQQASPKLPLLIGVDEEGGDVVRISDNPNLYSEAFPSPKEVYQNGGWDAVDATEIEKAQLLLSLGINVNMAPVCDVTSNSDSFIYSRSFSGDVDEVSTFVTKTVTICKEKHLGTVLKHFPGYGNNTDTHEDLSYDSRSYEDFQTTDFIPFTAGIQAGADCVLVAHNIVTCMDDKLPASLSPKAHEILRSELGFEGVIMTDDLAMDAIAKYLTADTAAVEAIQCGNDLLCCSDVDVQYPAVLAAVKSGKITEEQIDASVKRILQWKQKLGLLQQ